MNMELNNLIKKIKRQNVKKLINKLNKEQKRKNEIFRKFKIK